MWLFLCALPTQDTAFLPQHYLGRAAEGQNLCEVLRHGQFQLARRSITPSNRHSASPLRREHRLSRSEGGESVHHQGWRLEILDFGLAKLARSEGGGTGSSLAEVVPATEVGRVFGTVGYISPEEVRGQSADHRRIASVSSLRRFRHDHPEGNQVRTYEVAVGFSTNATHFINVLYLRQRMRAAKADGD